MWYERNTYYANKSEVFYSCMEKKYKLSEGFLYT